MKSVQTNHRKIDKIHLENSVNFHFMPTLSQCNRHGQVINAYFWLSLGVGLSNAAQSMLSRPMQRKLVTLVHCQLVEEEGRVRAMRAARSLGERTVTELILQHQNPQQLSSNLWAAVRARGCQFLGPGKMML